MPHQYRIVSRPIEGHAGRHHGIAIVDEHAPGLRQHCANFSILLADILYVIGHERLRWALSDFRLVIRIEQHRSIGVGWSNGWNSPDKHRSPVDWAQGHRLTRLIRTLLRQGHLQPRFTISI